MTKSIIRALLFSIREAMRGIRHNKGVTLLTVGTMSVAMTLIGFFFIILTNLDGVFESIKTRSELIVYLQDNSSRQEVERVRKWCSARNEIESVAYISRDEALADFKKSFKWDKSITAGLDRNPLPASFVITFKKGFMNSEVLSRVAREIARLPAVEEVEYGREWVERLEVFISFIRLGVVVLGWVLAAGLLFIVSNTIRLSVYSRKESIEIMKLVGATHRFIKGPFIVEGMIQGFLGSLLAVIILYSGYLLCIGRITEVLKNMIGSQTVAFLPADIIYGILLAGVGIGMTGTQIALWHVIGIRE